MPHYFPSVENVVGWANCHNIEVRWKKLIKKFSNNTMQLDINLGSKLSEHIFNPRELGHEPLSLFHSSVHYM